MALIALCAYCTEENGKLKYLKQTLKSLRETVDFSKHRLYIINNSPFKPAKELIESETFDLSNSFVTNQDNIGTAAGINLAIRERQPGEVVIKTDDDVIWHQSGWVEELERVIAERPDIGICGLKRVDVYGDYVVDGELQIMPDIMGTCTAFNPAMLDKVGYMSQCSPHYGFDDSLYSARSIAAGFKNAYLPSIGITHLEEGGTEYTEWKKREAAVYLQEVGILCEKYKSGQLDYYYDGGFDEN